MDSKPEPLTSNVQLPLVARLREVKKWITAGRGAVQLCEEAADEIERLRAALGASLRGAIRYVGYDCADCGAQIIEGNSICRETGRIHTTPKNGLGSKGPGAWVSLRPEAETLPSPNTGEPK
jgi:predicted RNA-binding Zn-ribbon protein involved in translation (DUF1610 family)